MVNIGICGLGFVGSAIMDSFVEKKVNVITYDKYKDSQYTLNDLLSCKMIFLCLPTKYNSVKNSYDKTAIFETCKFLFENKYKGGVILKSTVEPGTTTILASKYTDLNFIHNPEFLTARTAAHDYHNQTHIVLGIAPGCNEDVYQQVVKYHVDNYPGAEVSCCTSLESETMKIVANCFYSVKIQYFTEVYLLCKELGLDFNLIKSMIIKNGWVNPMHTNIPGPDGKISYGGLCFPKDTNAFLEFLKLNNVPHKLIESVIKERDTMRGDQDNIL